MSARPQAVAGEALGRYRLGPLIGRGATATVHRAFDIEGGGEVAVKIVPAIAAVVPRVRAEIRAVARLEHPGVVALLDWGEDEDAVYLVSELIEGHSLAHELAEGPVDARDAVRVVRDVLVALSHAHDRGVVHRDVKPANILVDPDGRGHLTDFGVARLAGESGLTATGGVVGTMAYMAPEQARGNRAGPRADVYAASLVLYEALTGESPLLGDSPAETARRAAEADVAPLGELRPDLPRGLIDAVASGLRRAPRDRPDAAELDGLLARAAPGLNLARHARRAIPLASGAAAGGAIAAGLVASTDLRGPPVAAAAIAAGIGAAGWPRATMGVGVAIGIALLAAYSPGAAIVLGAVAVLLLAVGWRCGRGVILPAVAPLLLALGLGPAYAAVAGLAPSWPRRLWAALAGIVAMLAWQVGGGTASLLFGGRRVEGVVPAQADELSPVVVGDAFVDALAAQPGVVAQAGVLVLAAMAFPLVGRAESGIGRGVAAAAWGGAIMGLAIAYSNDPAIAVAATLPTVVIAVFWGLRPWARLRRRGDARQSATLRGPTR